MTTDELEKLYFRALGIQQSNGIPDLPKSVRDDIAGLVDALGQAIAEADFIRDDRAKPADAEWFAGLPGVEKRERSFAFVHAEMLVGIRCYVDDKPGPRFWILGHPWPGGHPTCGQVLDLMAALGKKGGDA